MEDALQRAVDQLHDNSHLGHRQYRPNPGSHNAIGSAPEGFSPGLDHSGKLVPVIRSTALAIIAPYSDKVVG